MKSTGPPPRARRWPARRRSTAPSRSPSAYARFGLGPQGAQRNLPSRRPRPGRARSRRANRRGFRPRPRSASSDARALSAALSALTVDAARARSATRAAASAREPSPAYGLSAAAARRDRAAGEQRLRLRCSATARSARAVARAAGERRRARPRSTTRRRAPSRAAGGRERALVGARAACRPALAVTWSASSACQRRRASTRVSISDARARLRRRVLEHADGGDTVEADAGAGARLADALDRERVAAQIEDSRRSRSGATTPSSFSNIAGHAAGREAGARS